MYKVQIKGNLEKILKGINNKDQVKIKNYINSIDGCKDPYINAKKLVGHTDIYRYKVGHYRILTQIQNNQLTILIIDIDYRKDIYKRL